MLVALFHSAAWSSFHNLSMAMDSAAGRRMPFSLQIWSSFSSTTGESCTVILLLFSTKPPRHHIIIILQPCQLLFDAKRTKHKAPLGGCRSTPQGPARIFGAFAHTCTALLIGAATTGPDCLVVGRQRAAQSNKIGVLLSWRQRCRQLDGAPTKQRFCLVGLAARPGAALWSGCPLPPVRPVGRAGRCPLPPGPGSAGAVVPGSVGPDGLRPAGPPSPGGGLLSVAQWVSPALLRLLPGLAAALSTDPGASRQGLWLMRPAALPHLKPREKKKDMAPLPCLPISQMPSPMQLCDLRTWPDTADSSWHRPWWSPCRHG